MKNEIVTYEKFLLGCKTIAEKLPKNITALYGIPRGGYVPVVYISHLTNIPVLDNVITYISDMDERDVENCKQICVVDDISDTGKTLQRFKGLGYTIATLYYHKQSLVEPDIWIYEKKDKWIQFPWEQDNCETTLYKPNTKEGIKKWKEKFE